MDKLTNFDICRGYKKHEFYFMRSDFLGAFAYNVVAQSPYDAPDITLALKAFAEYVGGIVPAGEVVTLTYDELKALITEDVFAGIPDIEKLNHPKNDTGYRGPVFCSRCGGPKPDDDFIDLGALARNVFFMMLRQSITQGYDLGALARNVFFMMLRQSITQG